MCRNNIINTSEMNIDLGKDIDEIINDFNVFKIDYTKNFRNELVKCVNCNFKDIDNKYNYNNLCVCCNKVICLECYNKDDLNLDDIICNFEDNRDEWMCKECGYECEECNEYYNEDYFRSLLDRDGDSRNCCLTCINDNDMCIDFDGECYEEILCRIREKEYEKLGELEVDSDDEEDDDVYYIKCNNCKLTTNYDFEYCYKIDDENICGSCVENLYHM